MAQPDNFQLINRSVDPRLQIPFASAVVKFLVSVYGV
jgi:hypothetical protein